MKKIFALLLVAALVMSIAPTVLAAAPAIYFDYTDVDGITLVWDDDYTYKLDERFDTEADPFIINLLKVDGSRMTIKDVKDLGVNFFLRSTRGPIKTASGSLSVSGDALRYTSADVKAGVQYIAVGGDWASPSTANEAQASSLVSTDLPNGTYLVRIDGVVFDGIDGNGNLLVGANTRNRAGDARYAFLKIEFTEELLNVKSVNYGFTIEARGSSGSSVIGRMKFDGKYKETRRYENVNGSWDYIELDEYDRIVEPTANVNRVVIGGLAKFGDLEVTTRLYRDRDVYVLVSDALDDDKYADIAAKHPEIVTIYKFDYINLADTHATVKIGDAAATDYIYNEAYELIGRGNATALPLSKIYYIATSEVDWGELGFVEADDEPEDLDDLDDDDLDDFDIGGDTGGDTTPFNVNDNPGTGC